MLEPTKQSITTWQPLLANTQYREK